MLGPVDGKVSIDLSTEAAGAAEVKASGTTGPKDAKPTKARLVAPEASVETGGTPGRAAGSTSSSPLAVNARAVSSAKRRNEPQAVKALREQVQQLADMTHLVTSSLLLGSHESSKLAGKMAGWAGNSLRYATFEADTSGADPRMITSAAKEAVSAYVAFLGALARLTTYPGDFERSIRANLPGAEDAQPKPAYNLGKRDEAKPATMHFIDAMAELTLPKDQDPRLAFKKGMEGQKELSWREQRAELALTFLPSVVEHLERSDVRKGAADRYAHGMYRDVAHDLQELARGLLSEVREAEKKGGASERTIARTAALLELHYDFATVVGENFARHADASDQHLYSAHHNLSSNEFWRVISWRYDKAAPSLEGYPKAIQNVLKRELEEIPALVDSVEGKRLDRMRAVAAGAREATIPEASYKRAKGHLESRDEWLIVPEGEEAGLRAAYGLIVERYEQENGIAKPQAPRPISREERTGRVTGKLLLWAAGAAEANQGDLAGALAKNDRFAWEMAQAQIDPEGVIDAFYDALTSVGRWNAASELRGTEARLTFHVLLSQLPPIG